MKKLVYTFIVLQFAVLPSLIAQSAYNAEITYIGNEGFMIKNNSKKIYIDALYYYSSGGGILNVDTAIRNRIIANKDQFADADLFLITHNHPDHYDQTMMTNFLTNNPQATLIAQPDIISGITKASLAGQKVSVGPAESESIDTTVNGIPVTVYNLIHAASYRTYNVGYMADIDGFHIFHTGDNVFEDTNSYVNFKINEKNIDVAFLNYSAYWRTPEQRAFVKKYINPKYVVLIHISTTSIAEATQLVSQINDTAFQIKFFNTSMESAVVYEDTFMITNHMPARIGSVKDTAIDINQAFSLSIPELFEDEDAGDTLIYKVTNLPAGFVFNNTDMTITGSSSDALVKKVTITATDRNLCSNSTNFKLTIEGPEGYTEEKQMQSTIFPNPASDILNIQNTEPAQATVMMIYDMQGKLIMNLSVSNTQVDISELSKGLYTIKLFSANKNSTHLLMKQ